MLIPATPTNPHAEAAEERGLRVIGQRQSFVGRIVGRAPWPVIRNPPAAGKHGWTVVGQLVNARRVIW
jgi:hypothetical protein